MALNYLTLALLGAATAGAVQSYHFLTGRCALLDQRDKLRLHSRSLTAWDAACAAKPICSDIVVCLTTTPGRISRLQAPLKSLLYQDCRPLAIRLHIPEFSQREQVAYQIPAELRQLTCIEIVRCADLGPATKLLPALGSFDSRQKLLVVDDDRLYPPNLVREFDRWSRMLPDAALGMSGWRVPSDLTDRPLTLLNNIRQIPPAPIKSTRVRQPQPVDILMGYTGYLVRPACFDLPAVWNYADAPDAAFYVDDVWISAHCTAPKYVIPGNRHCFIPRKDWFFYDRTALYRINDGGGNPEQRNTTIMIRYFKERWFEAL
jgi:hypothetical protein